MKLKASVFNGLGRARKKEPDVTEISTSDFIPSPFYYCNTYVYNPWNKSHALQRTPILRGLKPFTSSPSYDTLDRFAPFYALKYDLSVLRKLRYQLSFFFLKSHRVRNNGYYKHSNIACT